MAAKHTEQRPALASLRTSVRPDGCFLVALHRPSYRVANMRDNETIRELGRLEDGGVVTNACNFPPGEVAVPEADGVYEIANPFPFRGTTYIGKAWADARRDDPCGIRLRPRIRRSRDAQRRHCEVRDHQTIHRGVLNLAT